VKARVAERMIQPCRCRPAEDISQIGAEKKA